MNIVQSSLPQPTEEERRRMCIEWLAANREMLVKLAMRITWNTWEADDAVQDALINISRRKAVSGSSLAQIRGFVCRCVMNAAKEIVRVRLRKKTEDLDGLLMVPAAKGDVFWSERIDMGNVLAGLRSETVELLLQYYGQNLSAEECAALRGVPLNTYKTQLHRARMEARKYLAAA